jgi:hypothetical protein
MGAWHIGVGLDVSWLRDRGPDPERNGNMTSVNIERERMTSIIYEDCTEDAWVNAS